MYIYLANGQTIYPELVSYFSIKICNVETTFFKNQYFRKTYTTLM